jgi:hypothetical protein
MVISEKTGAADTPSTERPPVTGERVDTLLETSVRSKRNDPIRRNGAP